MTDRNTTPRDSEINERLRAHDEEFAIQEELERERFLQAERIRRARDEAQAQALQKEIITQEKKETGRSVGKVTFISMLTVAIICDVILALIALIPFVGWIINFLLGIIVFLTFFIWFKTKGMKYTSARKIASLPLGFLIEMIPYINILPGWTVSVIINTQGDKVASKVGMK